MDHTLSLVYLPVAVGLGALHAIEPGHAKTLTAAYLIGIKGTTRDALLLGVSVAATHSIVVIALAATALWLGKEAFTEQATHWLQIGSAALVIALGAWLLWRRVGRRRSGGCCHHHEAHDHHHDHCHHHGHEHPHDHHDHHDHGHHHHGHDHLDDEAHARAHAASMPAYVGSGERPAWWQIVGFGAAGGLIPCPASVTVMLLALSVGQAAIGMAAVLCFSLGLAAALVGVGVLVVLGVSRLTDGGRFQWFSRQAPAISAVVVMLSGVAALLMAH
jgi:nickel/cobalt exporter